VYLRHLSLANFRSYPRLDLDLGPGRSVFWGDNGRGKSNLLEAVYLLATSRSFRTSAERDLVNWFADTQPVFARVAGEVSRHGGVARLEVILAESTPAATAGASTVADGGVIREPPAAGQAPAASVRRRVRINGQDRPVMELLGHLNAVLFSPEDVELVAGPAEGRRRYLDITLCQVDRHYLRDLRRYVRLLAQRNALLRQARERPIPPDQFEYWDAQLTETGAALIERRLRAVSFLNQQLARIYPQLTSDGGRLRLEYRSTVPLDGLPADSGGDQGGAHGPERAAEIARRFTGHLLLLRPRERAQGVTLAGPHRDDAAFLVDGVDLRTYGSRGQQRTAALSLKLAEAVMMQELTGERPVLLLDDVMSELDPARREYVQAAIAGHEQVLLTATDLGPFESGFLGQATRWHVREGQVVGE
jgi:DNA replication and repair protein RecF